MAKKVQLDQLLVQRGLAETRTRAQALILAGSVRVAGAPRSKAGEMVAPEAQIEIAAALPYASRGGYKLAHALDTFGLVPVGLVALDVGASTGGFTDVLLQRGAARVYAVDVGYGLIDWRLRQDPRVVVVDRTNIRYLEALPQAENREPENREQRIKNKTPPTTDHADPVRPALRGGPADHRPPTTGHADPVRPALRGGPADHRPPTTDHADPVRPALRGGPADHEPPTANDPSRNTQHTTRNTQHATRADCATIDVSFISLRLVLPAVQRLIQPGAWVIALVKPQFEAGVDQVGKNGVVRDPAVHAAVLREALEFAAQIGLAPHGLARSPIIGPAGNVEFLAWLGGEGPTLDVEQALRAVLERSA